MAGLEWSVHAPALALAHRQAGRQALGGSGTEGSGMDPEVGADCLAGTRGWPHVQAGSASSSVFELEMRIRIPPNQVVFYRCAGSMPVRVPSLQCNQ